MKKKIAVVTIASLAVLLLCIGIGSVSVMPGDGLSIIMNKLFGTKLSENILPDR